MQVVPGLGMSQESPTDLFVEIEERGEPPITMSGTHFPKKHLDFMREVADSLDEYVIPE